MASEKVRLRIGNLAKAVLVSGQAYQDPKDALNEFVSNAADEYIEAGRRGERIRVVLRRNRLCAIAVAVRPESRTSTSRQGRHRGAHRRPQCVERRPV